MIDNDPYVDSGEEVIEPTIEETIEPIIEEEVMEPITEEVEPINVSIIEEEEVEAPIKDTRLEEEDVSAIIESQVFTSPVEEVSKESEKDKRRRLHYLGYF